jgi:hypothetical protein
LLLRHAEIQAAMQLELVELFKRAVVEQKFDAFRAPSAYARRAGVQCVLRPPPASAASFFSLSNRSLLSIISEFRLADKVTRSVA